MPIEVVVSGLISSPVNYRDRALRSLSALPPFSPILNKLLADLASEDVSFAQIAELIEKDTVLAGNVLRLVNSALYGRRGTINSVRHAVSLMGLAKLRNTAMTLSVSRLWNQVRTPKSWSPVQFNLHSVAVAVLADLLAQKIPVNYPEGAFVAGLLHDIGLLLIAVSLPEEFEEIRQCYLAGGHSLTEAEEEIIGLGHAELSAAALSEWNLPEPIRKAVRYQEKSERSSGEELTLSRLLKLTNRLINLKGITILSGEQTPAGTPEETLQEIGLEPDSEQLMAEFDREFEPMRTFF